ncbi:protein of unknown function [Candidatus Nitrosotalea okcheonensis]|uniref:Uncharacterized protein n=1 Tax=Candidatus Nitrosotalea okcheonensis TaxID=1903276 RepID=A0A2H1FFX2_9ARCH|nr:protein of unknown function [Candidatus Nitrosotalea okcheonensis]
MPPIEIYQEGEIPPLAEMLYSMYDEDGLFFMVDAMKEVIEFLPQLILVQVKRNTRNRSRY